MCCQTLAEVTASQQQQHNVHDYCLNSKLPFKLNNIMQQIWQQVVKCTFLITVLIIAHSWYFGKRTAEFSDCLWPWVFIATYTLFLIIPIPFFCVIVTGDNGALEENYKYKCFCWWWDKFVIEKIRILRSSLFHRAVPKSRSILNVLCHHIGKYVIMYCMAYTQCYHIVISIINGQRETLPLLLLADHCLKRTLYIQVGTSLLSVKMNF